MSEKETDTSRVPTPGELVNKARGFMESMILLTAMELDIFTVIDTSEMTSKEISEALNVPHRSADRLLNAVCALGCLARKNGRFSNIPSLLPFLIRTSENFFGGYRHLYGLYHRWGTLPDAVRNDGRVFDRAKAEEGSTESFIEAMHSRAKHSAPALVAKIDTEGVERILDVGGGSGVFSMAFVRKDGRISAVVFDLPEVVELAGKYVEREGLSDRISTLAGNYHTDDFGSGYDLVFLSAIVHINSPEENRDLLRKTCDSLKPGGRIVIQDFIMEEDRIHPPGGAVFALNMLVNTEGGDTYTEGEIGGWLEAAGCVDISRIETGQEVSIITGRKPS